MPWAVDLSRLEWLACDSILLEWLVRSSIPLYGYLRIHHAAITTDAVSIEGMYGCAWALATLVYEVTCFFIELQLAVDMTCSSR